MAEMPRLPSLADLIQPPGPVFLRKMNKKSDWGSEETPPDERAFDVIKTVFDPQTHPFSVYFVRTDEELHRVIIGMNGNRESLHSESHFIAMRHIELESAGIQVDHSPDQGMTKCHFANQLHYDLPASEVELATLCMNLFDIERRATTFTKGKTRAILPAAEALGCLAVPNSTNCVHERCDSLGLVV